MAWTIGDTGFEMVLSAEVPRIIGREIRGAVETFLADDGVDTWAVHPGGRSVLDRVEAGEEIVITRRGRAVARLTPLPPTSDADGAQAAAAAIRASRRGARLGGLTIRDLIAEGRR